MKKFILTFSIFILFITSSVFADEVDKGNWINWGSHVYTSYDNPLIGAGSNGGYNPWYVTYCNEVNKGVVIAIPNPRAYTPYNNYYYVSYNNTFYGRINYNNYGNTEHVVPEFLTYNLTSSTSSGTPSVISQIKSKFNIQEDVYWIELTQSQTNPQSVDNADIHLTSDSVNDLYTQMENRDFEAPPDPNAIGGLPMLKYTITNKSTYSPPLNFAIKEIITWDFKDETVYSNDPTNYIVEIVASSRVSSEDHLGVHYQDTSNMTLDDSHKVVLSSGGCNVAQNSFSFDLNKIGEAVYQTYGYHWNYRNSNCGYNLYIRTRSLTTDDVSAWKIFNLNGVGNVTPYNNAQDGQNLKPIPNGQEDTFRPDGDWSDDSSTNAQTDPTSQTYNENASFNIGTVIGTLKSIVNSLGEIPTILSQLLGFMPEWLTSLILVSIGLLVAIGVTKTILG